jgi:transposase-like protein
VESILGHWAGDGSEWANFWLSVVTNLQARGVEDIFIASVDGLPGFKEAFNPSFHRPRFSAEIISDGQRMWFETER